MTLLVRTLRLQEGPVLAGVDLSSKAAYASLALAMASLPRRSGRPASLSRLSPSESTRETKKLATLATPDGSPPSATRRCKPRRFPRRNSAVSAAAFHAPDSGLRGSAVVAAVYALHLRLCPRAPSRPSSERTSTPAQGATTSCPDLAPPARARFISNSMLLDTATAPSNSKSPTVAPLAELDTRWVPSVSHGPSPVSCSAAETVCDGPSCLLYW